MSRDKQPDGMEMAHGWRCSRVVKWLVDPHGQASRAVIIFQIGAVGLYLSVMPWSWLKDDERSPLHGVPLVGVCALIAIVSVLTRIALQRHPEHTRIVVRSVWFSPWAWCLAFLLYGLVVTTSHPSGLAFERFVELTVLATLSWCLSVVLGEFLKGYLLIFVTSVSVVSFTRVIDFALRFRDTSEMDFIQVIRLSNQQMMFGTMDPNTGSLILLCGLSAATYLLIVASHWAVRIGMAVSLILTTSALALAASKSALVGLVLACVVFAYGRGLPRYRLPRRLASILPTASLVFASIAALGLQLIAGSSSLLTNNSTAEAIQSVGPWDRWQGFLTGDVFSLVARTEIWMNYFQLIDQWWIRGLGLGLDYQMYAIAYGSPIDTHNTFLQVAVQLGVIGFFLYIVMVMLFLRKSWISPNAPLGWRMFVVMTPLLLTAGVYDFSTLWFVFAVCAIRNASPSPIGALVPPFGSEVRSPRS